MTDGPLIVQSDKSLLLEVDHPSAQAARIAIAAFAELERAPEHVHTYRITDLGLWNARAAGYDAESVVAALVDHSRYPVPHALLIDVADTMDRYGRLRLESHPEHGLVLRALDRAVLEEVSRAKRIQGMLGERLDEESMAVHPSQRGALKQALLKLGWPAEDHAGYVDGEAHPIALAEDGWSLRPYQAEAVDGFRHGGSGVAVLPPAPAHPGRPSPPVEGRAAGPRLPHRGRERRVLGRRQGGARGDDRDLSGAHHEAEGDPPAPGADERPGLGPDHLRRGPPAA